MQVLYPRCCGLDVHKRSITGCCLWFTNTRQRQKEKREGLSFLINHTDRFE